MTAFAKQRTAPELLVFPTTNGLISHDPSSGSTFQVKALATDATKRNVKMAKVGAAIASGIIALGAAFAPAAFAEEAPQSLFPSAQTEQEAKNDRTSGAVKDHPLKAIFGSNFDEFDVEDLKLQVPSCNIEASFTTDPELKGWILLESTGGRRAATDVGSAAHKGLDICLTRD